MNRLRLLPAAAALVLAACPSTPPATMDSGCEGQLTCACVGGTTCSAGECIDGVCTDCSRGDEACLCRSNGTCNSGLMCSNQRCVTCTPGTQNCPCGTGDVCASGLTCSAGTCVPQTCTPGVTSCPCRGSDPKCDGTAYCDTSSVCQQCSPDVLGCPCGAGNTCSAGLVCDTTAMTCRSPVTCASLLTNGTCKPNQLCTETAGTDAVCVAATCVANFTWNPSTMACVACVSPGCTMEPTCDSGDGGIGDSCSAQHRVCDLNGQVASCGACEMGFTETPAKTCVPAPRCGAATCMANEYCDPNGGSPICKALPCGAGQAQTQLLDGGAGACSACSPVPNCTGAGFSGRIWPYKTLGDVCLCETVQSYFIASGSNAQAQACDSDGDGWVHEDADRTADLAIRANSRCDIRRVSEVQLVDEFGTALRLKSCSSGGMLPYPADGGEPCASVLPLRLLETERNDVPGQPIPRNGTVQYGATVGTGADGGTGRLLEANELNSLTKACVATAMADYNGNGTDDILEVAPEPPVALNDDRKRLESFAFFTELYTASYVAPTDGGTYGVLSIAERSRCSPSFPLHYAAGVDPRAPSDLYRTDGGQNYWRNCDRRRDPTYLGSANAPTYDFAGWNCSTNSGSCPVLPPAHRSEVSPVSLSGTYVDGGTDPAIRLMRGHGLCEMNGNKPKDGLWRGMNHHSQFKCVNVTATPTTPYDRDPAAFNTTGSLVFNQCTVRQCADANDPTCRTTQGTGAQTAQPTVECKVVPAATGLVGFAAVKFKGYGPGYSASSYQGGCVTEDIDTTIPTSAAPLKASYQSWLCPYPEYNNLRSAFSNQAPKADATFGRCSCCSDLPNFLWANPVERATLRWAASAGDTTNGFLR